MIYADPPWDYDRGHYQDKGRKPKEINEFYPTMDIEDIKKLPVKDITKDNCLLFIWVTDSHLAKGIEVINSWGFDYKTVAFNWIKKYKNGSRCVNFAPYTLKSWELCLLGTKGTPTKLLEESNIQGYVKAERTKHSKKPNKVRKRIEQLVEGKQNLFGINPKDKIELFAREKTNNWDVWGNEV